MRRKAFGLAIAALMAVSLAACATVERSAPIARPAPRSPSVSRSTPPSPAPNAFASLPGWADDDHAAALAAFRRACPTARDPALADACRRAAALGPVGEAQARRFLEANFRPEPVGEEGLLTAYFAPVYEVRETRQGEFTAPVRPRPADLPEADWTVGPGAPYAERAAIEARPTNEAIGWMKAEDLFFLQVQGSGVLVFPSGRRAKAVFDGVNGARFRGIAAPMREQGLLADSETSGEEIRAWLAAHRGPQADAIMRLNPRYVFFRLAPDDGADPAGAAGLPLIPGRAVAVDLSRHALGDLIWIDAAAPALSGAFPVYRRLTVALDTGGAIKGDARADLYLGRGPAAGLEAGRVRHTLRMYRLAPMAPAS
ncbi:MAG TPA: MltA domain-containing protein [Caulobacteraceae bacterium]|jgi:membrane-bound lytic murein transglycosylase A|nr:MltA domain-containing protein [Caulobacteraceae bacterium]